jgi:thiosulfate/3-mercaptopyruvate sulfurtransferase
VIAPVVDAEWLGRTSADVVLADVRWYLDGRSGRAAYETGHLPGAVFVDLDEWLAAPASPELGRHPLPEPEVFARGMGLLGIADATTVVAYDDAGGVIAARLVWMLRALGREAALLDGGLTAWSGPIETGSVVREPAAFTAGEWPPDRIATIDDAAGGAHVIDARPLSRYLGEPDVDPRAGHIPGAQSLPCRENFGADGRFLPIADLAAAIEAVGIAPGDDVISYCGSGVTACHNLIALELAGFGAGRLYPGSWSQWAATDREAQVG